MTEEQFHQHMCEKYPELYADKNFGGFCVGAGWCPLLEGLSAELSSYMLWRNIPFQVDQIKEKLGTLRFYYTGGDDVVDGMVRMAERFSERVCETCGAPAVTRNHRGWLTTLCETHYKEQCK
jgi:hypothetical protein